SAATKPLASQSVSKWQRFPERIFSGHWFCAEQKQDKIKYHEPVYGTESVAGPEKP
ncbi:hypothetical protein GWI33_016397, partial [Rhynchophorus ferrugineus]